MSSFLSLLLIIFIFSADTYFIVPWLKFSTLMTAVIAAMVLGNPQPFFNFSAKEKKYLKRFLVIFYLFLFYMLCDNYFHGLFVKRAPSAIVMCFYPFFIFSFQPSDKSKLLFFFLCCFIVYNGIFCLLQIMGFSITVGSLTQYVPFLSVDRLFQGETSQGLRISGAYANCIGLAAMSGMCAIIFFYSNKFQKTKGINITLIYLIISIYILFLTKTRAAFLGLPIAVLFIELMFSKYKVKTIKYIIIIFIIFTIVLYAGGLAYLVNTRLISYNDSSFISRIQINYYAIVGTWDIAPLTGIPYGSAEQAILIHKAIAIGMHKTNMALGVIRNFITFHCEPAFYFRSYGLIGFILYVLFYFTLLKYIQNSDKHLLYKTALICIVLFFFLYNLMHNIKLIQFVEFWILLSLDFKNEPPVLKQQESLQEN